ncbi:hypothetical protein ACFWZK_07775 [[Kitasatospora] papulosa]|uniref:hypothetical protein n=1 Tax=[Kitasatospora] papulosa TaxID=1464011 RepID=UPI0036CFCB95
MTATDVPTYGHEELYPALGMLVVASADMESRLRYVVSELAGGDDAGWIIFEGQSVEWLVQNGKAALGQLEAMKRWPQANSDRIREALQSTLEANRLRNVMIHGQWRTDCIDWEECTVRPFNGPVDHRIFHVCRSRYRKGFEERQLAISDVEALANKMWFLERELKQSLKVAVDTWLGRQPEVVAEVASD